MSMTMYPMLTASDLVQMYPALLPWHPVLTIIDPDQATEITRQTHLAMLLMRALPALAPANLNGSEWQWVLDLACGPGDFVLECAAAFPHCNVWGLDRCLPIVYYARARARSQRRENVCFKGANILSPLSPVSSSLDLVNGQFLASCVPPIAWPALLRECQRVLRPGGQMRLVECLTGVSTSPAYARLTACYREALQRAIARSRFLELPGETLLAPDQLLRQAGFQHIELQEHRLDFSAGTPVAQGMREYLFVTTHMLSHFLIASGTLTEREYESLSNTILRELYEETFHGSWLIGVASGCKPVLVEHGGVGRDLFMERRAFQMPG